MAAAAAPTVDISGLERPLQLRKRRRSYSSQGTTRDNKAISIKVETEAAEWKLLTDHQLQIANAAHHDDADEEYAIHVRSKLDCVGNATFTIPNPSQITFSTFTCHRLRITFSLLPPFFHLTGGHVSSLVANGQYVQKELAFVYFIRRLASVCTVNQLIQLGFGRDPPFWGRVLKWMAAHIATTLGHKLEPSNISFFAARFPGYSKAIREKVNERDQSLNPNTPPLMPNAGTFLPFAFLDGNCTATCTPGSGPAHSGPGAPRNPNSKRLQEAFYTGWLHKHGIKHLTLDGPDGLVLFCWGPVSIRHNDLYMLCHSNANDHVSQAQAHILPVGMRRCMYGDSIFPWRTCLRSRFHASAGAPHKVWKDKVDKAMSSARECVEHHYGEADMQWPFMAYSAKLKIVNMDLASLYTSKVLLRNFYVCLYGNLTSERFNCKPMELEEYAA